MWIISFPYLGYTVLFKATDHLWVFDMDEQAIRTLNIPNIARLFRLAKRKDANTQSKYLHVLYSEFDLNKWK